MGYSVYTTLRTLAIDYDSCTTCKPFIEYDISILLFSRFLILWYAKTSTTYSQDFFSRTRLADIRKNTVVHLRPDTGKSNYAYTTQVLVHVYYCPVKDSVVYSSFWWLLERRIVVCKHNPYLDNRWRFCYFSLFITRRCDTAFVRPLGNNTLVRKPRWSIMRESQLL